MRTRIRIFLLAAGALFFAAVPAVLAYSHGSAEVSAGASVSADGERGGDTLQSEGKVRARARLRAETEERRTAARASTTASTSVRVGGNAAERAAERVEKLTEKRKEMIRKFAHRLFERIAAGIERIEKLSTRIESRIAKFKARGVVTAEAEASLSIAKEKTISARAHLELAKTAAENAIASASPKEAFASVRAEVSAARDELKSAHRALILAITKLKGSVRVDAGATTTTTVQ